MPIKAWKKTNNQKSKQGLFWIPCNDELQLRLLIHCVLNTVETNFISFKYYSYSERFEYDVHFQKNIYYCQFTNFAGIILLRLRKK